MLKRRNSSSIIFALLFLFSFSIPVFGQHGKDRKTHRMYFDTDHLKIEIDVRIPEETLIGKATMSFTPVGYDLSEIKLNAEKMDIKKVSLSNGTPLEFAYENPFLTVKLDRPYDHGEKVEIVTEYTVTKPEAGFFFIDPQGTDPNKLTAVWTQGQTNDTRKWVPCFDWTNDRITTELIATVPDNYVTVSNGLLISEKKNGDGTKTVHWKQKMPHVSYLITFVAGEYYEYKDSYNGMEVNYYVFPKNKDYAKLTFGRTPEMIKFFEGFFGHPFAWEKYSQIEVRDFTAGAMENTSATTFRETYVHDKRAGLDFSADPTVSHELSHQWFGDLVTCEDWGELWLNESFATYSSILWREYKDGIEDAMIDLMNNQNTYLAQAAQQGMHSLRYMQYPNSNAMFDGHSYQKGSVILHGLRNEIGTKTFKRALAYYLKRNEFTSVETDHFRQAVEHETGRDMRWWFNQWVMKKGHPVLNVSYTYDTGKKQVDLTVKQVQNTKLDIPIYTITVPIEIDAGDTKKLEKIVISKEDETFSIPFPVKPEFVCFDKGYTFLRVFNFPKSTEEFAAQMKHDTDVIGRLLVSDSLAVRVNDPVAEEALIYSLKNDKSGRIRAKAARGLKNFTSKAVKKALTEALEDPFARVRRDACTSLPNKMDKKLAKKVLNIFKKDESYYTQAAALQALAEYDSSKYVKEFKHGLKMDSYNEVIRSAALNGLIKARPKEAVPALIEYSSPKYAQNFRFNVVQQMGNIKEETPELTKRLKEILNEKTGFLRFFAAIAFDNMGSEEGLKEMQKVAETAEGQFKGFLTFRIARLKKKIEDK